MLLNRLVSVGLMIALGALAVTAAVSLASDPSQDSSHAAASGGAVSADARSGHDNQPDQANNPLGDVEPGADRGLEPRQPVSRIPNEQLVVNRFATGRLIVKFKDQVRARPAANARLNSLTGRDLRAAELVLEEEGGHFAPLFEQTPEQLRALEVRAAHASNVAQPDLAGMMYVQGIADDETLQRVARRLNSLDIIEFVDIEVPALPMRMFTEGIPQQAIETYRRAAQIAAQRTNPQVTERTRFEAQVNEAFELKQSTVDRINLPKDPQGVFDIEIPIHGLPVTMRLEPHSVHAEDFQMHEALPDGSMLPDDLEPERMYRGQLVGFRGSQVVAAVLDESVVATVVMPDGHTFFIEPVRTRISDVDPAEHVVYEYRDAIADRGQSGFGPEHKIGAPVVPHADRHPHQSGGTAFDELAQQQPCGVENSGHCLTASMSPGCEDETCCNVVLAIDPACATVWNERCAILAAINCDHDTDQPTPDLTAFQAYRTSSSTPGFQLITGGPQGEGFDIEVLYSIGQELADLGIGEENLARGKTVRVAVIESAFFKNHEDLDVTPEPGQTMWLNPLVTDPDHGTAVLGIISAVENDFGMTGLAPDADAYFFPTFSLESGGRLPSAILSAINEFEAGDVMNFSIGFPFGEGGFDCAEGSQYLTTRPGIYPLILMASQLGITSVMSAGNSCCNLEATGEAGDEDSGAFVISAVEPGLPYCRESFSNFTRTPGVRPPHFSAWGSSVATLGYGGLWTDEDAGSDRAYTANFGGTSAAAPMVAGLVVNLQGLIKQFYGGISLMPTQIRDNIDGWADFAPQCLLTPQPNPDMLGWCDDPLENPDGACMGDILPQDPPDPDDCPGTLAHVARFPSASAWGAVLLDTSFFPDAQFGEIYTIRGTYLSGNVFSVSAFDGIVYNAESEPTNGGSSPSFIPPGYEGPLNNVVYRATGQIADVLFVHNAAISGNISSMTVQLFFGPTQVPGFVFVELYDWDNSRWSIGGFTFTGGGSGGVISNPVFLFNPSRFVNNDSKKVLLRAWAFGFQTPPGPGVPPEQLTFTFPIDLLDIDIVSYGAHD